MWFNSCELCQASITVILTYGMLIGVFSSFQLSFQMWTNQMQETLNSKKKGDVAFRHKDFRAAIECYTQVRFKEYEVSPYKPDLAIKSQTCIII